MWTLVALTVCVVLPVVSGEFNLVLLHTNDIHARIEETNKYSAACKTEDADEGKCFGGIARLRTMIDQKREEYPNRTILLDGGDQFQGTLWFTHFGGIVSARFMNVIGYDAMTIGNHEFDRSEEGLSPFANNLSFPLLCSNADFSNAPGLKDVVQKSTIVNVGGHDIGVVGYTSPDTAFLSNPKEVTFVDELEAVQEEVDKLKGQGVNKIIALGHSGLERDIELAKQLDGVDVIVGGHSHSFLYNGTKPSNEDPVAIYPVESVHDGQTVLVVQDYAYGKYLGELHLTFDDAGKLTSHRGNPILLNGSVAQDPEVISIIETYLPSLEQLKSEVIGESLVFLNDDRTFCRAEECSLGNLVADGILHRYISPSPGRWSDVAIAFLNGGSLRAPIEIGNITMELAISVQPFRNTIEVIEISGKTIMDMLEFCASKGTFGGFLQVSGLQIIYDRKQPKGSQVVQVLARCSDCEAPKFEPLEMTRTYNVAINSFLINGGDGFSMIQENIISRQNFGFLDVDILVRYIRMKSPVFSQLEGRIQFIDNIKKSALASHLKENDGSNNAGFKQKSSGFPMLLTLSTLLLLHYFHFN